MVGNGSFVRASIFALAGIGIGLLVLTATGFVLDVRAFDRTSGGHEPPYTDYIGEPIDWARLDRTSSGMAYRGHTVNVLIDCTDGMMHFEFFKVQVPFRTFSPRAIAVHKPREACRSRGFNPAF